MIWFSEAYEDVEASGEDSFGELVLVELDSDDHQDRAEDDVVEEAVSRDEVVLFRTPEAAQQSLRREEAVSTGRRCVEAEHHEDVRPHLERLGSVEPVLEEEGLEDEEGRDLDRRVEDGEHVVAVEHVVGDRQEAADHRYVDARHVDSPQKPVDPRTPAPEPVEAEAAGHADEGAQQVEDHGPDLQRLAQLVEVQLVKQRLPV